MSALHSLIEEVVATERQLVGQREAAEKARNRFVEVRQKLDAANSVVSTSEDRLSATREALHVIAGRDSVTEDVLDQLLDNERAAK